ncbi:MAG: hypothetical protein B6D44_07940 [Ignavibacteriales bacterium UTCHB2]|nr:MAG: MORN repeat variant [Ignavibacteria bacterium ADurb.Bin266]OQY73160.1 MAG: hypothetical protein B6D44_07940 [Ignavibacteriales bacterium UTCHB2]HQI41495.1 hypothetical protein [Ignavibacteriaceae bacterium]
MKNLLILLFAAIVFYGCDTKIAKPIDGKTTPLVLRDGLLYPDSTSQVPFTGRNKSRALEQFVEYDVVNGIKEGDFIIYFPNQHVEMIGKMSNNLNVGEWKYYRPDGSLETVGNYVNDIPSGNWTWYYPNGKIVEEGVYKDGKRDGKWISYDSTGAQSIIRTYKEDKLIDSILVAENKKSSK